KRPPSLRNSGQVRGGLRTGTSASSRIQARPASPTGTRRSPAARGCGHGPARLSWRTVHGVVRKDANESRSKEGGGALGLCVHAGRILSQPQNCCKTSGSLLLQERRQGEAALDGPLFPGCRAAVAECLFKSCAVCGGES